MALSPPHKFGQIIGNLLEEIIQPILQEYCDEKGLYLDFGGRKREARKTKNIIWTDAYGNEHDLDFVIEKDGSDLKTGQPLAFIECAWRRYTKHSRNKAQEIQGAILPLAEKYEKMAPFLGIVLAGEFTEGSLRQLKSRGFKILHFPYSMIIDAFAKEGIDIKFDESTPDKEFSRCIDIINGASKKVVTNVKSQLIKKNRSEIDKFVKSLTIRIGRKIDKIIIVPLYGTKIEFLSVKEAENYIESHITGSDNLEFQRYEIIVKYSNSDRIEASFETKKRAQEFLRFAAESL